MASTPWCLHAADFLRRHPEIPFAVHLTVVSEYQHYRWGPLAAPADVPSLLDESGYFFGDDQFDHLLATADIGELETEFRAQIEALRGLGLDPTHLDSHYGPHEQRQDIFDLVVSLAREYGLAVRAGSPDLVRSLLEQGLPAADQGVLDSGRIPPEQKAEVLAAKLRELPAGLSEWALHPGIATDELRAVMADPRVPGVSGHAGRPAVGFRRGRLGGGRADRGGGRHSDHRLPAAAAGLAGGRLGTQRPCGAFDDGGQGIAGFEDPVDDALGEGCADGGVGRVGDEVGHLVRIGLQVV